MPSHDPSARPLGCNDAYGASGAQAHKRAGTPVCDACAVSARHYRRELARGRRKPRKLKPCGTWAAAARHRRRGEPVDFACALAESDRNQARVKVLGRAA